MIKIEMVNKKDSLVLKIGDKVKFKDIQFDGFKPKLFEKNKELIITEIRRCNDYFGDRIYINNEKRCWFSSRFEKI